MDIYQMVSAFIILKTQKFRNNNKRKAFIVYRFIT